MSRSVPPTSKEMINPGSLGGGGRGGVVKVTPYQFFWLEFFAACLIAKSFGTTVLRVG